MAVATVPGYLVAAVDGPVGRLADVLGASPTTEGAVSGILVIDVGHEDLRAVPGSRVDDIDVDARLVRIRCRRDEVARAPRVGSNERHDLGLLLAEVVEHYFSPRQVRRSVDDDVGDVPDGRINAPAR